MSLLLKMKELAEKAKQKAGDFTGGSFGGFGSQSSSPKDYGNDCFFEIKVGTSKIEFEKIFVKFISIDSGKPNEAGVCVMSLQTLGCSCSDKDNLESNSEFLKIKLGKKITVKMASDIVAGKPKNLTTTFVGVVESAKSGVNNDGSATFEIRAMDAMMWMMPNVNSRTLGSEKTCGEVVKDVLSVYKFPIGEISISNDVRRESTFYQVEESDYHYLCSLADEVGAMFFVQDGKFYFISPDKCGNPVNKVRKKDNVVRNISNETSLFMQCNSVTVQAPDPKDPGKTISGKCSSYKPIGLGRSPSNIMPKNFSSNISGAMNVTITDNSIRSKEEAKARALAELGKRNMKFYQLNVELKGNPKLKVGQGFETEGFGSSDGSGIITSVKHIYSNYGNADAHFTTEIIVNGTRSNG